MIVQVIGGVNATALIFTGVGAVLWIVYAWLIEREVDWRRALGTTMRIGLLTLAHVVVVDRRARDAGDLRPRQS